MKKWDNIDYQKIENASFEGGVISVRFYNDDIAKVPIEEILPLGTTDVNVNNLEFRDYEISLTLNGNKVLVPWDKVRVLTDKDFAQNMIRQAEENNRIVGERLKKLRRLKGLVISELAEKAQVSEHIISQIENGREDFGFAILRQILTAMGCSLRDLASAEFSFSTDQEFSWEDVQKKLTKVGINASLSNKIIPEEIRKQLKISKGILSKALQLEVGSYFSKIFGWSNDSLWSNGPLSISSDPAQLAFFKTPSKGNLIQIKAYSHYAYYLAKVVCKVDSKTPQLDYPGSLEEFKEIFYKSYDKLTFNNLLHYTWDMGIRVIPLNDQGVFHGASWNIEGTHVIILKQRNESHARWIFDLLHELYHVFVHLDSPNSSIIETEEMNPFDNNNSQEEKEANSFANQFIFGNKSEEIAKSILEKADNKVEFFKGVIEDTANESKINSEFIANYLALRLQMIGVNWWGVANSFQTVSPSPFDVASAVLKNKIRIETLNLIDQNLLTSAITN